VAKRENKVGKLSLFQPRNQLLEVTLRKLSHVFFKNRLRGLGRRGVQQHDGRHIYTERLHNAGELLGQHPHADVHVPGRKAEFKELAGAPFHIFGGCAVIEDNQHIGAFKNETRHFQPKFHFVLLADDHKKPQISFSKAENHLVMGEHRADECDVIEFAVKRATELVHEEFYFA